jgi:hypothetical protein
MNLLTLSEGAIMGLDKVVEAIDRFFLDLIGTVIPGSTLLIGIWFLLGGPSSVGSIAISSKIDTPGWVLLVVASYALGYAVISVGENIVIPMPVYASAFLHRIPYLGRLVPQVVDSKKAVSAKIQSDPMFVAFVKGIKKRGDAAFYNDIPDNDVNAWRSVALTLIQEQSNLANRFMFISLLNLGIATSLLLMFLIFLVVTIGNTFLGWVIPLAVSPWFAILLFIVSLFFLERRRQFYARSMRVPFSMALAKLTTNQDQDKSHPKENTISQSIQGIPQPKVYLAGGFHSGWQDRVMGAVNRFSFYDPRTHKLQEPREYTLWDLEAIRKSDIVFAYLEITNPAGYALALELGYAKALGKRIILVDEKSPANEQTKRYLGMICAIADTSFETFEEGLNYLKVLEKTV